MVGILVDVDEEKVSRMLQLLKSPETSLPLKYRVMFSLRNIKNQSALQGLVSALKDESALFRHDIAFCLGQRQQQEAVQALIKILKDSEEHPMVRHEAGEALGAIGTQECLEPLIQFSEDNQQEVRETCELALQRIKYYKQQKEQNKQEINENKYLSVDPTPALPSTTPIQKLKQMVLDENSQMFDRYTALFALRNKGGEEAIKVLTEIFNCSSALLKHEVAYVLGQMQDDAAIAALTDVLLNEKEHAMVRHEAAEALGSIGNKDCINLLKKQCLDMEPIVADSCIVALDMMENGEDIPDEF
eukprot:TRINITY_DN20428_c0_g1_i1.p1 TRINITY_DN20428_c0_g1~~TRINITY_DN20428_c0_g1_i1.p1  ORF type:complete len:302 (+),score=52.75 TRINITY_DN20428_c0_g1_i1:79-984(+)